MYMKPLYYIYLSYQDKNTAKVRKQGPQDKAFINLSTNKSVAS